MLLELIFVVLPSAVKSNKTKKSPKPFLNVWAVSLSLLGAPGNRNKNWFCYLGQTLDTEAAGVGGALCSGDSWYSSVPRMKFKLVVKGRPLLCNLSLGISQNNLSSERESKKWLKKKCRVSN